MVLLGLLQWITRVYNCSLAVAMYAKPKLCTRYTPRNAAYPPLIHMVFHIRWKTTWV